MVPLEVFKKLEQQNEKDYPNHPRTLSLMPTAKKGRGFGHFGNNIAYTQNAPDDLSTGYYQPFEKSFTMEEKALIPSFGRPSTSEVLDIAVLRYFFGITEELRGKCHLVGGKFEAATIKTQAQAYGENRAAIETAMTRRRKRSAHRPNNSSNDGNNKRKR